MERSEAVALVKMQCSGVGFRDGQRKMLHAALQTQVGTVSQKSFAESMTAQRRTDTKLCNVIDVRANARAEQDSLDRQSVCIAQHPRVFCIEHATAGKPDNVVQETLRSMQGSILVVDVSVHVAGVAAVDERSSRFIELRLPALQKQLRHSLDWLARIRKVRTEDQFVAVQIADHEETRCTTETPSLKRASEGPYRKHKQLRLYAINSRSCLQ